MPSSRAAVDPLIHIPVSVLEKKKEGGAISLTFNRTILMPTLSCLEPSRYLETIMKRLQVIAPASEDEQKNPFVPHSHARDKHSESSQQPPMSDKRWAGSCLSVEAANNLRVQEERRHGGGENREPIESFIAKEETCRRWGPQSFRGQSRSPHTQDLQGNAACCGFHLPKVASNYCQTQRAMKALRTRF